MFAQWFPSSAGVAASGGSGYLTPLTPRYGNHVIGICIRRYGKAVSFQEKASFPPSHQSKTYFLNPLRSLLPFSHNYRRLPQSMPR